MANIGGFFDNLSQSLFGGGPNALQQLQNNGYSQYKMTQAPDVSGKFGGYGAQSANTSANAPYMQAQQQLLSQLQGQANGTAGPTVADQQLHAGLGATLAAQKAAMAGARGQNAGLASGQLGTEAANSEAGYAGQAGAQRAQEQQSAEGALGGLTQGAIGQGNQLGEYNATEQNQGRQFDAGLQAQLGGLQNQNWQYGNNLGAQQQSQQNAAVAGQTNQALAQEQQMMGNPLNQIGGMASTAAGIAGALADGGVIGMDSGSVVLPGPASNTFAIPSLPSVSLSSGGGEAMKPIQGLGGGQKAADKPTPQANMEGAPTDPNELAPDMSGAGGALGGASDAGGAMGGGAAAMLADGGVAGGGGCMSCGGVVGHADGCVASAKGDVANGPQKAIIGENGPEAVVPIKPNGDVDPARARNPALQALLQSHPALRHIQATGQQPGQPTSTGDRATAAALAQAGAHLSDRVAQLEATIAHMAKRNQRRAA